MKNFAIYVGALALFTLGTYIYVNWESPRRTEHVMELGGFTFPAGTIYENDIDEDLILTLDAKLTYATGYWPKGTKFYFEEDRVFGVEVEDDFEFAGFEFFQGAKIAFKYDREHINHVLQLTDKKEFDGLPLKKDCLVKFKDHVLESASCPEYQDVFFKRRLELPSSK